MFRIDENTKKSILTSWGSAGIGVVVTSPLEVIKMNAQVTSSNTSVKSMFVDINKTYGLRGFYKGLSASLLAQPGYWTFYWPIYNALKKRYSDTDGNINLSKKMQIIFASSSVASMTVNPLFVFKTRFQTSALQKNANGSLKNPNISYSSLIKNIFQREGIRGFYKGNIVAQVKNTQMLIQMPLYDSLNESEAVKTLAEKSLFLDRSFVSGVISKTVASCLVYYPIDSIRTNIRHDVENKSVLKIVKDIYRRPGGIRNFYRGVGIYWISAVPTFGIIMYSYEKLQKFF